MTRSLWLTLVSCVVACGGEVVPPPADGGADAAPDAGPHVCATAADCDDHVYCNGDERCMPGGVGADARGCTIAATARCFAGQTCNEAMRMCQTDCAMGADGDGDGHAAITCGGDDCDDADPNRYPGNVEVCDVGNHDEDCDPVTYGVRDADMDGYPDARCCNARADGTLNCGVDCDDARSNVNPAATEACNGIDDNCNGMIDEGVTVPLYHDRDGDGFGDAAMSMMGCVGMVPMYVLDHTDCNDLVMSIHPGAPDVCDATMVDDDCDGIPNDPPGGCACTDGASRPCTARGACASGVETCTGGMFGSCSIAPTPEVCNGIDDDCDGTIDNGVLLTCYRDVDDDGYASYGTAGVAMCPSADPTRAGGVHMGCPVGYTGLAPSSQTQSDCDDTTGSYAVPVYCYTDSDGDSYGAGAVGYECPRGAGYGGCAGGQSTRAGDCCDGDPAVHPAAPASATASACGGYDMNCDGAMTLGNTRTFTGPCSGGTASACAASSPAGWSGGVPGCGVDGTYTNCLRQFDSGLGALVCESSSVTETQACR